MRLNLIVGMCKNNGIGFKNDLPWHFRSDLKYFSKVTKGSTTEKNALIMGKNTWMSLPKKPLPGRTNYVLSSTFQYKNTFSNIEDLLYFLEYKTYDNVFVIGGSQIYTSFLQNYVTEIDKLYVTRIDATYECDTFFPKIPDKHFDLIEETHKIENETNLYFQIYQNKYSNER